MSPRDSSLLLLLISMAGASCTLGGIRVHLMTRDTSEPPVEETERPDTSAEDTHDPVEVPPVDSAPGVSQDRPTPLCELELDCAGRIVDEPKTLCELQVRDGWGRIEYQGKAGVELRGRSSVEFPKPQYAVELWDEEGEPQSANLLGMGGDPDWIFNGVYVDRALFRNKLGYDLFQAFSEVDDLPAWERYAAESQFCSLRLDGAPLGIFLLQERIKADDDRLPLHEDPQGGSFIVKADDSGGGLLAAPEFYGEWFLEYPSPERVTPEQREGVLSTLRAWQASISSDSYADPSEGMLAHLDLGSAVDFVILEEFTKNCDAYFLSMHLARDTGEKIRFIPWDLDLTFGYPYYDCGPEGWMRYSNAITRLATIPEFHEALQARWWDLRLGVLSEESILARLDSYRATFGDEVYRNFEIWPIDEIQFCWGGTCWLCPISSYDQEYERFREWVVQRLAWMDANITTY